ncbi:MAG: serine hydrolase domain-containing protein [bacterium]
MTTRKVKSSQADKLFTEFANPKSPGAAVMVIQNRKLIYRKTFGYANLEDKIPITPSTNFRLASFSKQFTAMAISILIDRKLVSLDTRLTDIFPSFPKYGNKITVRQLLHHTSGILDYETLIPKRTTIPLLDRDVLWILEQQHKTYFPPGTKWRYSNSGYALLAVIVEQVSGLTFPAFMKQHIFNPLGMKHTMLNERGTLHIPNQAFGYSPIAKNSPGFKRTDQSLTSYVVGDGGIYSSLNDLYLWDQALYTTMLVSRKMMKQIFTPGVKTTRPGNPSYGFGWFIGKYRGNRMIWHKGSSIGFTTMIKRFPDQKFSVIMLTNRNTANVDEITQLIIDRHLFY